MYEFDIRSKNNPDVYDIIFGYNFHDACRRRGLNPAEWHNEGCIYID